MKTCTVLKVIINLSKNSNIFDQLNFNCHWIHFSENILSKRQRYLQPVLLLVSQLWYSFLSYLEKKSSISFSYWEVVAFVVLVWIVFFLYAYLRNSYTLKKTKMEEIDSDYDTDDVDKDDLD